MGWAKFSDDTHANEHILPLSHAAFRLWASAIMDNRGYKDGRSPFISKARAEALCRQQRIPRRSIKDIESAGRWEPTEGGWNIHDYSEYLPTRREDAEDVERDQKKAEAGRKGAAARWHADSTAHGTAMAEPKQADGKVDGSRARARVEPVPVPVPVPVPSKAPPSPSVSTVALRDAIQNGHTDDLALQYAVRTAELLGRDLAPLEVSMCGIFLEDFAYLSVDDMLQRMHDHVDHCKANNLPTPRKLHGFRETLRLENEHRADARAPKAWRADPIDVSALITSQPDPDQ